MESAKVTKKNRRNDCRDEQKALPAPWLYDGKWDRLFLFQFKHICMADSLITIVTKKSIRAACIAKEKGQVDKGKVPSF
jgi:hypothetical protein